MTIWLQHELHRTQRACFDRGSLDRAHDKTTFADRDVGLRRPCRAELNALDASTSKSVTVPPAVVMAPRTRGTYFPQHEGACSPKKEVTRTHSTPPCTHEETPYSYIVRYRHVEVRCLAAIGVAPIRRRFSHRFSQESTLDH